MKAIFEHEAFSFFSRAVASLDSLDSLGFRPNETVKKIGTGVCVSCELFLLYFIIVCLFLTLTGRAPFSLNPLSRQRRRHCNESKSHQRGDSFDGFDALCKVWRNRRA